ncbi:MAG: HupE/UreJ family protein [Pseudomonadota bacterium]
MRQLLALVLLLVPAVATAHVTRFEEHNHAPGITYTTVGLAVGQVRVLYTVPRVDLQQAVAVAGPDAAGAWVLDHFALENAGKPCPGRLVAAVDYDAIAAWQFELEFACAEPLDFLRLYYDLFKDDPAHQNFTEVLLAGHTLQLVLGQETPYLDVPVAHLAWERGESWELPETLPRFPGAKPTLSGFFVAGFQHVLTGYDHLAFVLGLVLVLTRFAQLAWTITAFTLAHTLTVGVSAAGLWVPPPSLIEPLIAASILYIGLENLFELYQKYRGAAISAARSFRRRWPVALVFGLVHGFGFAYMLREMGLPEGQFLVSLVAFNIGVEVGQLAVVTGPLVALYFIVQRRTVYLPLAAAGSAAVGLVGAFLLFERLTG